MKALLLAAVVLSACRQEEVTRVQVPKAEASAPAPMAAMGGGMGGGMEMPSAPTEGRLRWTLPAGWKETAGSGMRLATLTPPGEGKAEVTVVALPGDSGGELANVNRWRGQIGLPATDEAGVAAARSTLSSKVGSVVLYDFVGGGTPKTRLIAAVAKHEGTTWFIKLTGNEDAVKAAKPGFESVIKSLTP